MHKVTIPGEFVLHVPDISIIIPFILILSCSGNYLKTKVHVFTFQNIHFSYSIGYLCGFSSDCDIGRIGANCDVLCRYPNHGKNCQFSCNCSEDNCDPAYGCQSICIKFFFFLVDLLILN